MFKKILFLVALIIVIPYIIVTNFIKEEKQKFEFMANMNVRVMRETGIIDLVPFEDYIVGVLAGEMPITFEMEALKAQAVAARSYVMRQMINNTTNEYDVVDTIMNQVYLDSTHLKTVWGEEYDFRINRLKTAVIETSLEYLDYKGQVAEALYFSTSVGKTENSEEVFVKEVSYLRSVESPWDEISPVFEVDYSFSLEDFYEKLGLNKTQEFKIEIIDSTSTGRIKELKINDVSLTGKKVVESLGLRSNHFTMNLVEDNIQITTKGFGHGVGMSQYGAQAMALKGHSYTEILAHYYLGTTIKKI